MIEVQQHAQQFKSRRWDTTDTAAEETLQWIFQMPFWQWMYSWHQHRTHTYLMILDIQSHTCHFIHFRYASIPRANIYLFDLKLISQLSECQGPNKIQSEDCSVRLHNIAYGNRDVIHNVKNLIVWQGISFKMCKNCTNITFYLGHTTTKYYVFTFSWKVIG